MKNPAVQTGAEAGESAPSVEFAERLLQRRTEPAGVIDVRHAQRQYARTAGWVAQRFALLDHWKTRYGGDEDAGTANSSLVFAGAGRPGVEPAHTLSSPIHLSRAVNRADASRQVAAPPVSDALQGQFRVMRRGATPVAPLQDVTAPKARLNSDSPADGDNATPHASHEVVARSQADRGAFRAVEIPAIMPHAAPDLILPRPTGLSVKTGAETVGESAHGVERPIRRNATSSPAAITTTGALASGTDVSRQHSEAPSATAAPVQSPVRVSRVESTPDGLPLRLQRKPGEAATALARARESESPASARMPLSDSSAPLLKAQSFSGGEGASPDSLPLIQRRPASGAPASEAARDAANNQPVPMSAEIRVASSQQAGGAPQPAMIWRRSVERSPLSEGATGAARSALPLAISAAPAQAARQEATTAEPTSSTGAERVTTAPPAPTDSGIDVARLAEQVSRLLARQLAVERERRGRGGWR
jgi:hypothetical protein